MHSELVTMTTHLAEIFRPLWRFLTGSSSQKQSFFAKKGYNNAVCAANITSGSNIHETMEYLMFYRLQIEIQPHNLFYQLTEGNAM